MTSLSKKRKENRRRGKKKKPVHQNHRSSWARAEPGCTLLQKLRARIYNLPRAVRPLVVI